MYGINWTQFIWERIPAALRKTVQLSWLAALIAPVQSMYNRFLSFRSLTAQDLTIGPSVRELQYWANRLFDPADQRIEILDYTQIDPLYIFLESENSPVYLSTFIGASNYDFEVRVHCELRSQEAQLRGFLDRYKLATKRYIITWFGVCAAEPEIFEEQLGG